MRLMALRILEREEISATHSYKQSAMRSLHGGRKGSCSFLDPRVLLRNETRPRRS
jgi:hypothetical protein